MTEIQEWLLEQRNLKYQTFQAKLIPTLNPETIIGVKTPELRKKAKELKRQGREEAFLKELPHTCFEENQIHAFLLGECRDFEVLLRETERFLPYIDNWATCDQFRSKTFQTNARELVPYIERWISSDRTYTIRFGIGMLNAYFLEELFDSKYLELVAEVRSREYYVNMMIAWFFASALTKRYEETLPYIEQGRLDPWVCNKAIQKARESFQIPPERKAYLQTLKIKEKTIHKKEV